jgi:type II secretory pathway component GspD/PulD (secretin)
VPIRGSILFRSAAAFFVALIMVAITYAAEPTTMPQLLPDGPATTTGTGIAAPTTVIAVHFRNASISQVLDDLSAKGGFTIVKLAPVSGRITLQSPNPIPRDDIPAMLDMALQVDGWGVLRQGDTLTIDTLDNLPKNRFARPASSLPGKPPPTTMLTLNFHNVAPDAVLSYVAEKSGYIVIKKVLIPGRVTCASPQPVSSDDIGAVLGIALAPDGVGVVQVGNILICDTIANLPGDLDDYSPAATTLPAAASHAAPTTSATGPRGGQR